MGRLRKNVSEAFKALEKGDSKTVYQSIAKDLLNRLDTFEPGEQLQVYNLIVKLQATIDKSGMNELDELTKEADDYLESVNKKIEEAEKNYVEFDLEANEIDDIQD